MSTKIVSLKKLNINEQVNNDNYYTIAGYKPFADYNYTSQPEQFCLYVYS